MLYPLGNQRFSYTLLQLLSLSWLLKLITYWYYKVIFSGTEIVSCLAMVQLPKIHRTELCQPRFIHGCWARLRQELNLCNPSRRWMAPSLLKRHIAQSKKPCRAPGSLILSPSGPMTRLHVHPCLIIYCQVKNESGENISNHDMRAFKVLNR